MIATLFFILHSTWALKSRLPSNEEHYLLEVVYTAASCIENKYSGYKVKDDVNPFTIVSLQPMKTPMNGSTFCDPSYHYTGEEVAEIDTISADWMEELPTVENSRAEAAVKYGTCALDALGDMSQYFKEAVKLHRFANLSKALEDARIKPSPSPVSVVNVWNAWKAKLRFNALTECRSFEGQSILYKVFIVVNSQFRVIEPPIEYKRKYNQLCPNVIRVPAIPDYCLAG
ncbi:putative Ribonuclease T2 family protein [Blattamonas nauphoetae]|uniref:Ribonuclease T2 family protein n=1 Tax=Blattamonas nauphoetae TaxID=2049346 RepID=A0ABQ9XMC0_9EUKA|nr:putative Ribonuclease T2 family protein [Blattamonas nauphoetae]